eukprot:GEMP01018768.1.p1 GENE.GEMP01018768.1~~GEMP01018768.1.p1  ORF type:complete len:305 (-),score=73.18 GEMP01018768.1:1764-2678(-)
MAPPAQQQQMKSGPLAALPPVTTAAIITATVMYPVDVVRALVMANPGVGAGEAVGGFIKNHGFSGFIKQGLGAELMNRTVSRIIKFWLQPVAHEKAFGIKQKDGTAFTKGTAGLLATIPEVICISPFENIKLAEQLDKEKKFSGMSSVASHLLKTRGITGLYIGYMGMQFRQGLWTGGFFLSLDVFKGQTNGVFGKGMTSDVCSGFLAGVFGTCLNCWTDVTRTIIQKEAVAQTFDASIPRPSPMTHVNPMLVIAKASQIASERGVFNGLYAGFGVKAFYLGGSGALLALLVPRCKAMFGVASE